MSSILNDIKKLLGVDPGYDVFDQDIIVGINTAFNRLWELGIGPATGFSIEGGSEEWTSFDLGVNTIHNLKSYVHLRVRLLFDPPTNASLLTALQQQVEKLEWTLNVFHEGGPHVTYLNG